MCIRYRFAQQQSPSIGSTLQQALLSGSFVNPSGQEYVGSPVGSSAGIGEVIPATPTEGEKSCPDGYVMDGNKCKNTTTCLLYTSILPYNHQINYT